MPDSVKHIIITLILYACTSAAIAQTGFFVPQQSRIYFFGNTSTIFSNVLNKGHIGINKGALVNFKGLQWENDPKSQITDESINGLSTIGQGGMIRFLTPDTTLSPLIDQQQLVIGGYNAAARSGPSFPNLSIANSWGVKLLSASTKVRRELNFIAGNIYVNDNILIVGDG